MDYIPLRRGFGGIALYCQEAATLLMTLLKRLASEPLRKRTNLNLGHILTDGSSGLPNVFGSMTCAQPL